MIVGVETSPSEAIRQYNSSTGQSTVNSMTIFSFQMDSSIILKAALVHTKTTGRETQYTLAYVFQRG